jgi:hypothetical protein
MIVLLSTFLACGDKEDTATVEPSTEPSTETDTDTGESETVEPSTEPDTDEPDTDEPDTDTDTDTDTDEPDTDPVGDCDVLSIDECGVRSDCNLIYGTEIAVDTTNDCYDLAEEAAAFGCMSVDMMCTEAITYAQDPSVGECTWFSNGCIPTGWVSCSVPAEECN